MFLPKSESSPRSCPPLCIVSPRRPSGWGYLDTLASPRTLWTVDCIVSLARAALKETRQSHCEVVSHHGHLITLFIWYLASIWLGFDKSSYDFLFNWLITIQLSYCTKFPENKCHSLIIDFVRQDSSNVQYCNKYLF